MWLLGLLLLVALLLAAGALVALVWFLASPKGKRPKLGAVLLVPLGFVALPIVALTIWTVVWSAFQKNDLELYQEIFGTGTRVPMQAMLFDEFGHGRSREIYMRISPDYGERDTLLSLPGLQPSGSTLEEFVARGGQHGFMWWLSLDRRRGEYCETARILEADGFRGWQEFRIAECLDRGEPYSGGSLYVIAWHRTT